MRKLTAFYFSGTGNTRYVTETLCKRLAGGFETNVLDISARRDLRGELEKADCILLAFPVYGSSPPVPMRQFLYRYADCFPARDVIIVATQYMFSGDGAASLGRSVEKCGGRVIFAEHFRMPNNLADCKAFKIRNGEEIEPLLKRTDRRIARFAQKILQGRPCKRGFNPFSHALGYFSQRALWRRHENDKKKCLRVDTKKCVGCGLCVKNCPVRNLRMELGKARPQGQCALCYRCVNLCPQRAITLIGKNAPQRPYKGPPLNM